MILVGFVIVPAVALKIIAGASIAQAGASLYFALRDLADLIGLQYADQDAATADPPQLVGQGGGLEFVVHSGAPRFLRLHRSGLVGGGCCGGQITGGFVLSRREYTYLSVRLGNICRQPPECEGITNYLAGGFGWTAIDVQGNIFQSWNPIYSVFRYTVVYDDASVEINPENFDSTLQQIGPPAPTAQLPPTPDGEPLVRPPAEPPPQELIPEIDLNQQFDEILQQYNQNTQNILDQITEIAGNVGEPIQEGSDTLANIIANLNSLQNQIAGLNPQITNGLINDLTNLYQQGSQAANNLLQNNATQLQQLTGIDIPSLRDGLTQITTGQTALTNIVQTGLTDVPQLLPAIEGIGDVIDGVRTKLDECCATGSAEDCCDLIQEIHEALFANIQGAVFFKSCDPDEFNIPTVISSPAYLYAQAAVDVVADGFNRVLDILCELEKKETIAIASVPGHWPTTVTDTDAQLVVQFSEIVDGKETGKAAQLTIPHYGGAKSFPGFPDWRRGSYYARATLTSGRRLQIYADSENKAITMINACLAHVGGGYASNPRIVVGQMVNAMSDVMLTPVRAYYYPAGRTSMKAEWCIKPDGESCRGWQAEGATPL